MPAMSRPLREVFVNPHDPAVFIEKRIGIGYDLSFGNPRACLFM